MGGTCLNVGCIPSKALISAAERYEQMKDDPGWHCAENVKVDFAKVQEWKQGIVAKLTGGVESLLKGNKVEVISGEAIFLGPNEVRVNREYESERLKFEHCIVATGSKPTELKAFPFGGPSFHPLKR